MGEIMYIDKELLEIEEIKDPIGHLKNITMNALKNMETVREKTINDKYYTALDTLNYIGEYATHLNIESNSLSSNEIVSFVDIMMKIRDFYIIDLRSMRTNKFTQTTSNYEFKKNKLEEMKQLVHEVKEEITNDETLNQEEKDNIIVVLEELDEKLTPETNDVYSINGILLHINSTFTTLKFNKEHVKNKVSTIFTTINNIDNYVKKVQSAYIKLNGLVEQGFNLIQ